jgi:YkoY family integral membrane protein
MVQSVLQEITSYTPFDYLTIATLVILEGLLSVDNALVLATIVRKLPRAYQRKALTYGVFGAVLFRIFAVVLATYLIKFAVIKLIGGVYLLYLAFRHMFPSQKASQAEEARKEQVVRSFWSAVLLVELTDIAFSIDSITAAVAMTTKVTVIIFGGITGILAMRFVAIAFIKLLEKFPKLEDIAYQLIFFIGIKISLSYFHFDMDEKTFWLVVGFIVLVGSSFIYREKLSGDKSTAPLITAHDENCILDIARQKIAVEELIESNNTFSSDFIRYLLRNGYLEYTRKATIPKIKKISNDIYAPQEEEGKPRENVEDKA